MSLLNLNLKGQVWFSRPKGYKNINICQVLLEYRHLKGKELDLTFVPLFLYLNPK